MPALPTYIQYFVLIGILLLAVAVPVRVLWEATRGGRERAKKNREFADRLRDRFAEVEHDRGFLVSDRIRLKHEERGLTLHLVSPKKMLVRVDKETTPAFHALIRTKCWLDRSWIFFWESMRFLSRFRTHDALVDDRVAIYSSGAFGNYLRELALDGIPLEGKAEGVAESLVVLSNLPGVRKLRLTLSPHAGLRMHLKLRAEDVFYRPEILEPAFHHLLRLHDSFIHF